jgi:hypothetical protein
MSIYDDKTEVVPATAPPTKEHRKAARTGRAFFGGAILFVGLTIIAFFIGRYDIAAATGGITVALTVVGLMLHWEGERQRQRRDRPGHRPSAYNN